MKTNNDEYIKYNSLITINLFSEEYGNNPFSKYLITEDNLEHSLCFKLCKKPLRDYSNLKRSYFYIRKIEECISVFEFCIFYKLANIISLHVAFFPNFQTDSG